MARVIIGLQTKTETHTKWNIDVAPVAKARLAGPQLERRVKQKRKQAYISALCKLDGGVHTHDPRAVAELAAAVELEFEDLGIDQRPIGFVQKCILGPEYEVHILDLAGSSIVAHYKIGEAMPAPYETARKLATHPSRALLNTYAFVEVFADGRIVAVYADGPVTSQDPTSI